MARFNPDEMAMRTAQQALDGYVYEGKTLREWVSLIKSLDTMPPRLLTLEEALFATGVGWEEIWFDADEEEGTPEYRECFPCVFINGHYVCYDGDIGEVSPDTYNKPHHSRLWMGWAEPTEEQREAAKWEMDGTSSGPAGHLPPQGEALEKPAAYPADQMEHRYSGLLSED